MSRRILLRAFAFTVVTWFAANILLMLLAVAAGSGVGEVELTLAGVIGLFGASSASGAICGGTPTTERWRWCARLCQSWCT
jgi:uncharacterized membrane protein YbhN (UPF0104 family)